MNETDVIGHLIQIESEAANMLLDAQAEVDRRITEAKVKAENSYKDLPTGEYLLRRGYPTHAGRCRTSLS